MPPQQRVPEVVEPFDVLGAVHALAVGVFIFGPEVAAVLPEDVDAEIVDNLAEMRAHPVVDVVFAMVEAVKDNASIVFVSERFAEPLGTLLANAHGGERLPGTIQRRNSCLGVRGLGKRLTRSGRGLCWRLCD